jgi:hypothetical protein
VRSNHAHVKSIAIVPRRDGYCTAQEYLLAAWDGDVRLFVMNGHRLMAGKRRRVNRNGHMRYTPAASGVTFHVEHIVQARRTRHGDGESGARPSRVQFGQRALGRRADFLIPEVSKHL